LWFWSLETKFLNGGLDIVNRARNSSYLGGNDWENGGLRPAWAKKHYILFEK
jgi:hypothetical protein